MIKIEEYCFTPGARTIIQMGEELIGHPSTALAELVKNTYDADATECKVYVYADPYDLDNSFIIILDNGIGMSKDILFKDWLQPSISNKRLGERKSEKFERNFLGSKGIGRLASMVLGENITVISKQQHEVQYNWISFSRGAFKEEVLLSTISFPGGISDKIDDPFNDKEILQKRKRREKNFALTTILPEILNKDSKEGTLFVIENLDESIREIMLTDIRNNTQFEESSIMRSLKTLITPLTINRTIQDELLKKSVIDGQFYKSHKNDEFKVYFGMNFYSRKGDSNASPVSLVKPLKILENYDYRVLGKVDIEGNVFGYYSCRRLKIDPVHDDEFNLSKNFVFSTEAMRRRNKEQDDEMIPEEGSNPTVGEFYFDIRVYDRDPDSLEKMMHFFKEDSVRELKRILDKLISLRISRNGFGVKPYGEEDPDWMGLGQSRVQEPVGTIGPNQVLGYLILSSPQNDSLQEKTNREGFFENKAFIDLKRIVRAILIELGRRRYKYRLKHNLGRTIRSTLERPSTKQYLDFVAKKGDTELSKKTEIFIDSINSAMDNLEETLTFSQRLATLGSGLELVYHEMAQPIGCLGGVRVRFEINVKKIAEQPLREKFSEDIDRMKVSISTLDTLKDSLEPAIGKAKPEQFSPMTIFEKVKTLFTLDLEKQKIDIILDKALSNYLITDYDYPLWIAFLNIFNNAVYWLKRIDIEDGRFIKFSLENDGILVISNNSARIPEDDLDLIFEYGVTGKPEKNATGLGLAFTRSILSSCDWKVWAENREYGPAFLMRKVKENDGLHSDV